MMMVMMDQVTQHVMMMVVVHDVVVMITMMVADFVGLRDGGHNSDGRSENPGRNKFLQH